MVFDKKEYQRVYNRRWRDQHPQYYILRHIANRERHIEMSRKWREKNPEYSKIKSKQYRATHLEYTREKSREWHTAHHEYDRIHCHKYRDYNKSQLLIILTLDGETPRCVECDQTDKEQLEFHHINADGYEDRKKYGSNWWGYYVQHPNEARQKLLIVCHKHHKRKMKETLAMRRRRKEVLDNPPTTVELTLLNYI